MLFFSASGMVGVTTAFNAVSTHATCTAVWMVVVFVVSFGLASVRTLGKVTWLAWPAFFSILSAGEYSRLPILVVVHRYWIHSTSVRHFSGSGRGIQSRPVPARTSYTGPPDSRLPNHRHPTSSNRWQY